MLITKKKHKQLMERQREIHEATVSKMLDEMEKLERQLKLAQDRYINLSNEFDKKVGDKLDQIADDTKHLFDISAQNLHEERCYAIRCTFPDLVVRTYGHRDARETLAELACRHVRREILTTKFAY